MTERDALAAAGLPCVPCGLNADWSVRAWHIGAGRPNVNVHPQLYLLDTENGKFAVVLRQDCVSDDDTVRTLYAGTLERCAELCGRIFRARREVLDDIAAGTVPASVDNYADLHTYVDANYYGGAFETPLIDPETGELSDEVCRFWDAVQNAVHFWLQNGRK